MFRKEPTNQYNGHGAFCSFQRPADKIRNTELKRVITYILKKKSVHISAHSVTSRRHCLKVEITGRKQGQRHFNFTS